MKRTSYSNHLQRFYALVSIPDPDGCWLWLGAGSGEMGYGMFSMYGKRLKAHRVSYEFHVGQIPEGMLVCHTCDNPKCVRPDHLWLGTNADNMRDMVEKGRADRTKKAGDRSWSRNHPELVARGERQGRHKLTEVEVVEIRRRAVAGERRSGVRMAREYGVCQSTINYVISGHHWRHLPLVGEMTS